uniref:Serine protease 50 n=1 Tax=Equus caballus TaxID=9796 RepID=F7E2I6_HORSE
MESRCGKRGSRMSAPAPTVLLLLLLLLRPAGCLGAGEAPGALCVAAPTDPGAPCAPSGTGPSGKPRLHRLVSTIRPQTFTIRWPDPVSKVTVDFVPTCGVSYEQDPTLRDPEAMARRWPWMVSVQANGTHICAGTLIASQWVLTVAHCLIQRDVVYSVRAGSPWIDQMVQTTSDVPVSQVIVNSKFQSRRYWSWIGQDNDIALLKLEGALKYSKYIGPICLPGLDYVMKDQSLCTVTGWGRPRADGVWPQFRTIQEKEVTVVNSTECDSVYHRFSKIPSLVRIINSQMICAEDLDREQFCYETSGEPLACPVESTWYLVGMVPGFNLLPGPWHAAIEDTAQSDNCSRDRAGLAGAGAWTPQEWYPTLGLPLPTYVCLTQRLQQEAPHLDKTPVGSGISKLSFLSGAGFVQSHRAPS